MFHEVHLKLCFRKCPEGKVSQPILSLRPFSKYKKCTCFIYNVSQKAVSILKIKTLKHCQNLLKVSNEIKQYLKHAILDFISDFEQVFQI